MARPKIKSKPVRKYTRRAAPAVTEQTLGEKIIDQMVTVNATLSDLVATLKQKQQIDRVVAEVAHIEPVPVPPALLSVPADVAAAMAPPPKKRGRRTNAEIAAAKAAAEGEGTENGFVTAVKDFPKACACGVREDLPPHLHSHACPKFGNPALAVTNGPAVAAAVVEQKPAPQAPPVPAAAPAAPTSAVAVPAPAPTLDDVRGVAIAFAGKHGKEKLAEVLKGFKSEKLSTVAPGDLAALMAKLQAGV